MYDDFSLHSHVSLIYLVNIEGIFSLLSLMQSENYMQAFVFDFQPEDPENIYTALAALSGRAVPGEHCQTLFFTT